MSGLIGRAHAVAALEGEIARVDASHGGLVLVAGEAGIGKSALVAAGVAEARRRGALVVSGACWDSGSAPGFWPWTQVVRAVRRQATEIGWPRALGVLVGESPGGAELEEFQLFDAVATALVEASQERAVMVVLEDLHWADEASLRLLEFAAQHTWFERLLVVGTYRDDEAEAVGHPLAPLISPLVAKATTLTLMGLDDAETRDLIARTAGRDPGPELAAEVCRRTGGNPFFIEQTARLWQNGGSPTSVPPGVRDALTHRLALLPARLVELLTLAAALGRRFHPQVLATCAAFLPGGPEVRDASPPGRGSPDHGDGVRRLLERAVAARLIGVEEDGCYAFAHDLVRDTLYARAEAAPLHALIVRSLREAPEAAARVLPADLARHAGLAGAELPAEERVRILRAASDDALTRVAVEEAAAHLRRACAICEDPAQRVVLLLDLGRTLHHAGMERAEMWRAFLDGAALAVELGEPALLGRAALILDRTEDDPAHRTLKRDLLRRAYREIIGRDPGDHPPGRLADELSLTITTWARDGDDDEELAFSLWARHDTIWGLGTAAERVQITEEMAAVARRRGDHDTEQFATSLHWVALLELGDPAYLEQWRSFLRLAERLGTQRFAMASMVDTAIIEVLRGGFGTAWELLERVMAHEERHPEFGYMGLHLQWSVLLPQGRTAELEEVRRAAAAAGYSYPGLLEGINALQRGDLETALRHRDAGPYDRAYQPLVLRFLAELAAVSGDRELAGRIRAELAPYRGQWLVSLYGCDISGPVDLWLARLDAAEGRWAEAVEGLRAAAAAADRMQARTWSVEARYHLGAALAATRDPSAATVRAAAVAEAAELGMRHLAETGGAAAEFRRDGAVWTLRYAGRAAHLPDAKGLRDLHTLMLSPGTELAAVELLDPAAGPELVAARRMGGDPVLDATAKTAYRDRLERLDDLIDRAAELGDDDRAAVLDAERRALLAELRTAAGLAGRDRRLGDEAERARKTVTARIRDALRKMDAVHPELAAHLRASVSTGSSCSYRPGAETTWRL